MNMFTQNPTASNKKLLTTDDALRWFHDRGIAITEWSMANGFNPGLVYAVLGGQRKCLRGQSYRIAVALGLKASSSVNSEEKQ